MLPRIDAPYSRVRAPWRRLSDVGSAAPLLFAAGSAALLLFGCAGRGTSTAAPANPSTTPAHGAASDRAHADETKNHTAAGATGTGEQERGDAAGEPRASSGGSLTATQAATTGGESAAARTPEVPAGTTVLHVGDSFAGALGLELNELFEAAGIKGVLRYKTATYIPTWAYDKDLPAYLNRYKPDLVLITLGANELKIPDPEARAATIRRLVARFGDRPCVWIAPPLWAEGTPLLDVIRRECAPCVYMDTNRLIPHMDRARDKIHPSPAARAEWAKVVYDWLAQHRAAGTSKPWTLVADEP